MNFSKVLLPIVASLLLAISSAGLAQEHMHHQKMKVPSAKLDSSEATTVIYQCPMDKDVKMKSPGKCPKCGMTLVKVVLKSTLDSAKAKAKQP